MLSLIQKILLTLLTHPLTCEHSVMYGSKKRTSLEKFKNSLLGLNTWWVTLETTAFCHTMLADVCYIQHSVVIPCQRERFKQVTNERRQITGAKPFLPWRLRRAWKCNPANRWTDVWLLEENNYVPLHIPTYTLILLTKTFYFWLSRKINFPASHEIAKCFHCHLENYVTQEALKCIPLKNNPCESFQSHLKSQY